MIGTQSHCNPINGEVANQNWLFQTAWSKWLHEAWRSESFSTGPAGWQCWYGVGCQFSNQLSQLWPSNVTVNITASIKELNKYRTCKTLQVKLKSFAPTKTTRYKCLYCVYWDSMISKISAGLWIWSKIPSRWNILEPPSTLKLLNRINQTRITWKMTSTSYIHKYKYDF